ncbi:MAG: hypothetical protein WD314_16505 [Trueperaceae bacterium]
MKRLAIAVLLSLGLGYAFAQDAADTPVEVRLEIFLVSEVQGTEQFRPATTARPGQTVEYRLTAVNISDETLPSGTVEIVGPIPPQTTFVPNSATASSERLLTEFSADDGRNFSEEPVLVGEEPDRSVAEPESYDSVRWTLLVPMEPGQEEAFFYRVVVD